MNNQYIGETVGIFEIIERMDYRASDGHALYRGVCTQCGFKRIAPLSDFKYTKKCTHIRLGGVYHTSSNSFTWSNKRLKSIFKGMKRRCYVENDQDYKWYGAKGIKICDEWLYNPKSFENWALANGYDDNLTIDRKKEDEDYCPENCQWVLPVDNSRHKSTTRTITVGNICKTGREWAYFLGLGTNIINEYVRKYGIEDTSKFIEKYMQNPNMKRNNIKQSYYDLYMTTQN